MSNPNYYYNADRSRGSRRRVSAAQSQACADARERGKVYRYDQPDVDFGTGAPHLTTMSAQYSTSYKTQLEEPFRPKNATCVCNLDSGKI